MPRKNERDKPAHKIEVTDEMIEAGVTSYLRFNQNNSIEEDWITELFTAMVNAADREHFLKIFQAL